MISLAAQLWRDERGFVVSAELVIIATVLVLGLIVGMSCLQTALVGEFKDLAFAMSSLNQSYHVAGVRGCVSRFGFGDAAWTSGSAYIDQQQAVVGHAGYVGAGVDLGYGACLGGDCQGIAVIHETEVATELVTPCEGGCPETTAPIVTEPCTTCETPVEKIEAPPAALPELDLR